jgi:hypothetical protein
MARNKQKQTSTPDTAAMATAPEPGRDLVAMRAYELYLARGAADGRELDDWLTAERELRERQPKRPTES